MNRIQITKLSAILYQLFEFSDWVEVFRLCELENYIDEHTRFLRSLKWNDDDAKSNCFKATEYLYSNNSKDFFSYLKDNFYLMNSIEKEIPDVYLEILQEEEIDSIDIEEVVNLNQILREAIDDAETLIKKGKPANAYDRIHTTLHGVLKQKCEEQDIEINDKATITTILSKIRQHILDTKSDDKAKEIAKILGSISKIINILNDMRNKKSLAHPNKTLLDNDEALFLINISKAIMLYVNNIMD